MDGESRWGRVLDALKGAAEEQQKGRAGDLPMFNAVGNFTNNGHVNLMILSMADAEQVERMVQRIMATTTEQHRTEG